MRLRKRESNIYEKNSLFCISRNFVLRNKRKYLSKLFPVLGMDIDFMENSPLCSEIKFNRQYRNRNRMEGKYFLRFWRIAFRQ